MQIGSTDILLKKISTVLDDNAKVAQNIRTSVQLQDNSSAGFRDLTEMLNIISADVAELDSLCDYANTTLGSNKYMLDLHDT